MLNQKEATGSLQLIRFGIGTETYCMDMSSVGGIQRYDRLKPNPANKGPIGWLLTNQESIPVFSIATRLKQPAVRDSSTGRILVLNAKPKPWAVTVDTVLGVIHVSGDRVFPMPSATHSPSSDLFKGVINLGEGLVLYVSPEHLHRSTELDAISVEAAHEYPQSRPLPEGPPEGVRKPAYRQPTKNLSGKRQTGKRARQILFFSTADPSPGEGAIVFGLSITQVLQILEPLPLVPVPTSPPYVLGLVNWRSRPVPVIDLDTRLVIGSPSSYGKSRLLIARTSVDGELVGFPIRPNVRVQSLPIPHEASDRELPINKLFTKGIFELENETLVVPDMDVVVSPYGNYLG